MKTTLSENSIATAVSTILSFGRLGTDNSHVSESDTALNAPDTTTDGSLDMSVSGNGVSVTYTLNPVSVTTDYYEFGLFDNNNNLMSHDIFPETVADNSSKLVFHKMMVID